MAGGGSRLGVVASQIIFDRLRSMGDMVIASRKMARNATAKMRSIAADTRIASIIMGIRAPDKISNGYLRLSIHDGYKIESDHCSGFWNDTISKKSGTFFLEYEVLSQS